MIRVLIIRGFAVNYGNVIADSKAITSSSVKIREKEKKKAKDKSRM